MPPILHNFQTRVVPNPVIFLLSIGASIATTFLFTRAVIQPSSPKPAPADATAPVETRNFAGAVTYLTNTALMPPVKVGDTFMIHGDYAVSVANPDGIANGSMTIWYGDYCWVTSDNNDSGLVVVDAIDGDKAYVRLLHPGGRDQFNPNGDHTLAMSLDRPVTAAQPAHCLESTSPNWNPCG
jgi:hypothetical protein